MTSAADLHHRTYAVVVNWNGGARDNIRCLRSLVAGGLDEGRIVFVDNASKDGSLEAAVAEHPGLQVIRNDANLGFGEAANQGARLAMELGAGAVAFINNDLWLLDGEGVLLGLCTALADDRRLGMVGPRVVYGDPETGAPDGRVWCAGGRLDFRQNLSTLLGHGQPDGPPFTETQDVDYVVGCMLLARRELLDEVGLFDASYFAYTEDVELGLRAREAGWRVRVLGEHRALHAPSSATGGGYGARRKWMQALNSVRFLRKHGTPGRWARFFLFDVATLPVLLVTRGVRGEAGPVLAKAKGVWDGFLGRRVTAAKLEPGASRFWR